MIIYIEYVIINNFVIDFLLLKTTFLLTGKKTKLYRLILIALLGAFISLVFPLIKIKGVYLTLIKILVGTLLVILSSNFKDIREFFINLVIFYLLTFTLGGIVIGVLSISGIEKAKEIVIALCFIPAFLVLYAVKKVFIFLYRRKNVENLIYDTELEFNGIKIKGRAFLDTGNLLYYKDSPVIVCEKSFIKKFTESKDFYKNLKKIDITTATGDGQNYCIQLSSFKIFIKDKPNIYNNVALMIAKINMVGVDILLNPALLGENYGKEPIIESKKVS